MPGGLLDMFGIDPVANRNRKMQLMLQELQNKGQMDVEKERNRGQLDVTKAGGEETRKKTELDAMIKWAEANGLSPSAISTLQKERDQLDKTKIGTRQTEAGIDDVKAKSKGAEYGINPMPGGVNPRVAEGIKRSAEAEAIAPAQQLRKAAAIEIDKPLILPNSDNPLNNSISPYLGLSKTGSYFDTKSGQMIPEQSHSTLNPGAPIFTQADIERAIADEAKAAEEAKRAAISPNANNPMFGKGLGVLQPEGINPLPSPEQNTALSTLLRALRATPAAPQPALFPGLVNRRGY